MSSSPATGGAGGRAGSDADSVSNTPETHPAELDARESISGRTRGTQSISQISTNVTMKDTPTRPDVPDVGMTVLYTPPGAATVVADIIFVHGLKGNPLDTWMYGKLPGVSTADDSKQQKKQKASWRNLFSGKKNEVEHEGKVSYCYWPSDLVPNNFKNVRVMTYGYDSHPTNWYASKTTQMTMTQHVHQLRNNVDRERAHCRGRPLVFVAHSLGGILVKDAIVLSEERRHQQNKADIATSCRISFSLELLT